MPQSMHFDDRQKVFRSEDEVCRRAYPDVHGIVDAKRASSLSMVANGGVLRFLQDAITLGQGDEVRIRIISTRRDFKETVGTRMEATSSFLNMSLLFVVCQCDA